jgi:hypothetical protein
MGASVKWPAGPSASGHGSDLDPSLAGAPRLCPQPSAATPTSRTRERARARARLSVANASPTRIPQDRMPMTLSVCLTIKRVSHARQQLWVPVCARVHASVRARTREIGHVHVHVHAYGDRNSGDTFYDRARQEEGSRDPSSLHPENRRPRRGRSFHSLRVGSVSLLERRRSAGCGDAARIVPAAGHDIGRR